MAFARWLTSTIKARKFTGLPSIAAAAMTAWSSAAFASEPTPVPAATPTAQNPYFTDRFGFTLGGQFARNNRRLRVDSASRGVGTTIDLEEDLGFDDNEFLPVLHAYWRMTRRWRLDFAYSRLHQSSSASANRTVNWGNLSFAAGAAIAADYNLDMFKLALGYGFYQTRNAEIGVSLGLNVTRYEVGVSGNASVNAAAVTFASDDRSFPAPLPTIGLYGAYAFHPRWLLRGHIDYTDLNVGVLGITVGGRILDVSASLEYQLMRNLTVGAGYRHVDVSIGGKGSDFRGGLRYDINGPFVFSRVSF